MATRLPHMVTSLPRTRDGRAGFYGLGWNVSYDDRGRLVIGHAGAFYLGAATYVHLIPGEDLGIVVLTTGERSEEPRVGTECVGTRRSRCSPSHLKKNTTSNYTPLALHAQ